jgi:hypothetical protein
VRVAICTRQSVPKSSAVSTSRPTTSAARSSALTARRAAGVSTHWTSFLGSRCWPGHASGHEARGQGPVASPSARRMPVGRAAMRVPFTFTVPRNGACRRSSSFSASSRSSASSGRQGWNLLSMPRAMSRAASAATLLPVELGERAHGRLAHAVAMSLQLEREVPGHPLLAGLLLEARREQAVHGTAREGVPLDAVGLLFERRRALFEEAVVARAHARARSARHLAEPRALLRLAASTSSIPGRARRQVPGRPSQLGTRPCSAGRTWSTPLPQSIWPTSHARPASRKHSGPFACRASRRRAPGCSRRPPCRAARASPAVR